VAPYPALSWTFFFLWSKLPPSYFSLVSLRFFSPYSIFSPILLVFLAVSSSRFPLFCSGSKRYFFSSLPLMYLSQASFFYLSPLHFPFPSLPPFPNFQLPFGQFVLSVVVSLRIRPSLPRTPPRAQSVSCPGLIFSKAHPRPPPRVCLGDVLFFDGRGPSIVLCSRNPFSCRHGFLLVAWAYLHFSTKPFALLHSVLGTLARVLGFLVNSSSPSPCDSTPLPGLLVLIFFSVSELFCLPFSLFDPLFGYFSYLSTFLVRLAFIPSPPRPSPSPSFSAAQLGPRLPLI